MIQFTRFERLWLEAGARRAVAVWVNEEAIDAWIYQPVIPDKGRTGELALDGPIEEVMGAGELGEAR